MNEKEILTDLREQFPHLNGKIYLKPKDLVPIYGISVGQQANLRSEGRLNIPLQDKDLGLGICVSIYDLAKFISEGRQAFSEQKVSKARREKIIAFWSEVDRLVKEQEAESQRKILEALIPEKPEGRKVILD